MGYFMAKNSFVAEVTFKVFFCATRIKIFVSAMQLET